MSTLEVSNLNDGTTTVATTYITGGSAKAWAQTDATTGVVANNSLNVSSIDDNGLGDFDLNFTSAFSTSDYAVSGATKNNTTSRGGSFVSVVTRATTYIQVYTPAASSSSSDATLADNSDASTLLHGDLA